MKRLYYYLKWRWLVWFMPVEFDLDYSLRLDRALIDYEEAKENGNN